MLFADNLAFSFFSILFSLVIDFFTSFSLPFSNIFLSFLCTSYKRYFFLSVSSLFFLLLPNLCYSKLSLSLLIFLLFRVALSFLCFILLVILFLPFDSITFSICHFHLYFCVPLHNFNVSDFFLLHLFQPSSSLSTKHSFIQFVCLFLCFFLSFFLSFVRFYSLFLSFPLLHIMFSTRVFCTIQYSFSLSSTVTLTDLFSFTYCFLPLRLHYLLNILSFFFFSLSSPPLFVLLTFSHPRFFSATITCIP
ncbi:unnamed protein product [Acanthosepion pharaonis]|uniref:Uncharacterized protein n=1 Tax=Acanthosepion pharaonis TaxID=158019 RepID=A0A812EG57_ACAPH|nr:unnamed protein product [Sepia pharaonis]